MYWGDNGVKAATSADLIHCKPETGTGGKILDVLPPRDACFDSNLAEGGTAKFIITEAGEVCSEFWTFWAAQVQLHCVSPVLRQMSRGPGRR